MGSIIFSFRNFRKAFTLIELMIVISIIGVLAAALYPQVGKYMSRGRDAGRITAITNINTALDLTRFDNNGNYLPHSGGCVPMANLVNRKYLMIPIQSPSGTGYNEGCGNNGQYAYGNMGIGYILMSTMENLFTGNYSGSTVGFTGTITRSGALNALNTKKGMGRYYIYPTNSILNSVLFLNNTVGVCGSTVNTCVAGTATGYVTKPCGTPENWGCIGNMGSITPCSPIARTCSIAGVCGTANGTSTLNYPTSGNCKDIAMPITVNDPVGSDGNFNWTCGGIGGGSVACSAKIQYTISGTFGNNGSGATVSNVGGKSTIADKTGYFSIKVDHETSAIGVKASRLGYTCKTTQAGSNKITANDTNIQGYCVLNNYTISGGWTNGAGAKVNVCGKNIITDSSGNFSLAISGATNCSSATASKSHYTFNNLSGPNYLASDYKFSIGTGTPDTQTGNCGTLPSNSTASTASTYTQTWNGIGWSPITKWTKGGSICGFTCNKNYTWNNIDSCIADTRTYTCAAKPATTIWNTVDSYNQTWNGTMWNPVDSTSTYDKISSKTSCHYTCASGYKWNSLSCELIMNGTCGSASGTTVSAYPTANLCNSGKLADIDMTGTDGVYNWDCNGSGGGTNISCSAIKILCAPVETLINGYYVIDPTQPNCSLGCNVAGLTDPTNKCILKLGTTYIAPGATDVNKINTPCGGSASPCSAAIKSDTTNVIGYCSGATWGGKTWFFPTYPTNTKNNLSLLLNTQTNYWTRHCENCDKYTGIKWRINSSGGSTAGNTASYAVRCESNSTAAVNGSCGTSNGGISASTPSTNLCTSGTSSSVSGTGPWTWNCSGSNGGTTEACNVNLGYTVTFDGNGGTGHTPTSKVVAYNAAVGTLPSTPPNRTGYTFNGWFTAKTGGTAVTAATVISGNVTFYAQWIINGVCGSANGVAIASYPIANLCAPGTVEYTDTTGSDGTYNWKCKGSGGGVDVSCSASKKPPTNLAWTNYDKTLFFQKYGNFSTRPDIATFVAGGNWGVYEGIGAMPCTDEGKMVWTGGGKSGGVILICQRGNWWYDTGSRASDYSSPDVVKITTSNNGAVACNKIGFRGYYPKSSVRFVCK